MVLNWINYKSKNMTTIISPTKSYLEEIPLDLETLCLFNNNKLFTNNKNYSKFKCKCKSLNNNKAYNLITPKEWCKININKEGTLVKADTKTTTKIIKDPTITTTTKTSKEIATTKDNKEESPDTSKREAPTTNTTDKINTEEITNLNPEAPDTTKPTWKTNKNSPDSETTH